MSLSSSPSTPFPPIPVTAVGMCTSLGGLVAGCAAARAGILRISELPNPEIPETAEVPEASDPDVLTEVPPEEGAGERNSTGESPGGRNASPEEEEVALSGHRVRGLPEGSRGMERITELGAAALADLFSRSPAGAEDLGRLGLVLCLPSGYPGWAHSFTNGGAEDAFSSGVFVDPDEASRLQAVRDAVLPRLFSQVPGLPAPTWTGLVMEDQAGFAEGVARAAALLSQGRLDSCLLGGIDSRLDPEMIKILEDLGLVASPDFPAGFIPGEAGAFLLLRAPGTSHGVLGWIDAAAQMADGSHRFSGAPPTGTALTESVRAVVGAEAPPTMRFLVLGSVNGSPWNSNEWGYLLTRLRVLSDSEHWFPVSSFGETGAAFGPVAACMALRGFERGYVATDRAVITLSSESGRKGAVLVRGSVSTGETA